MIASSFELILVKSSQNNDPIYVSLFPRSAAIIRSDRSLKLLLLYFGLSFNKTPFQSCLPWATGHTFQHGSNTEVHWVEIGRWRMPQFLAGNCLWVKLGFCMSWKRENRPVGWNIHFLKVFFHIMKGRVQSFIVVNILMDFRSLFLKNQKRFLSFWHYSPCHGRYWLMVAINR